MCKDFYFGCQPSTSLQNRDSQPEKKKVRNNRWKVMRHVKKLLEDTQYANELKKKSNVSDTGCIDGELVESIMCNIPNISIETKMRNQNPSLIATY